MDVVSLDLPNKGGNYSENFSILYKSQVYMNRLTASTVLMYMPSCNKISDSEVGYCCVIGTCMEESGCCSSGSL